MPLEIPPSLKNESAESIEVVGAEAWKKSEDELLLPPPPTTPKKSAAVAEEEEEEEGPKLSFEPPNGSKEILSAPDLPKLSVIVETFPPFTLPLSSSLL